MTGLAAWFTRIGAGVAVGCLLVAGCSSDSTTATSTSPVDSVPTTASPVPGPFAPGDGDVSGSVDIGGGRTVYLECAGRGSPTVVLISGSGNAGDPWSYAGSVTDEADPAARTGSAIFPRTARSTRVCTYDRPGTQQWDGAPSRSSTVPQPTTAQGDAADLHALLTAADVAGPYVIVGHSWGGLLATTYARTYPDSVSGLVLVDPASQFLQTVLPANVWSQWIETIAAAGRKDPAAENPDYPSSIAALDALPPLLAIPVVVLTADRPFDYLGIGDVATYWPQWLEAQALLATSLNATLVTTTDSGHFVAVENAPLVGDQICSIIAPTRAC